MQKKTKTYNFNLLVSCSWSATRQARNEIRRILKILGDETPMIKPTVARGILGVKTCLAPREVIRKLRVLFEREPFTFQFTLKWVPVDLWTSSDFHSLKKAVKEIKDKISAGERWRMTVEKRRYTRFRKAEIIRELAQFITEKVDLKHPDKILRVDILGKHAAISVLTPKEIFSLSKPYID